jgi:hypothetical protein
MNNYKMNTNFFMIVISIASFLLIVSLTYIGIVLSRNASSTPYPPIANACPDGWGIDTNGNCIIPSNTTSSAGSNNLGTLATYNTIPGFASSGASTSGTFNPNDNGWASSGSTVCGKKLWANKYNIQWDGVSNYNGC